MPAEFQKAVDYPIIGLKKTYCFLNDKLIACKGSEEEHQKYVFDCLHRLDEEILWINLPKCHFAKLEINWLGYHISQSRMSLIERKTSSILSLEAPKILNKLCSFLVSVQYISKFFPNLF